jgi:hypothetical protein
MPATANSRGLLKASTNRVRTSTSIQGSDMWESIIGLKNEERGANAGVEAMLQAPRLKQGLAQSKKSRQTAAAEAMKVTGNFNTGVHDYDSLMKLAKEQGAVGTNERRGACKVCGQVGHLTKQCRNQFSKFFTPQGSISKHQIHSSNSESLSSLSDDSIEKPTYHRKRRRKDKRCDSGRERKQRHRHGRKQDKEHQRDGKK